MDRKTTGALPALIALLASLGPVTSAHAASSRGTLPSLTPPVDSPIERRFEAPASRYGPGHRGIDYRIPSGTDVRAAAGGVVRFAGSVAGVVALTIDHGSGLETTYSDLADLAVARGDEVERGEWIGSVRRAHPGREGLHFGVKLYDRYIDPEDLLVDADVSRAIHLAPLLEDQQATGASSQAGAETGSCVDLELMHGRPPAPNDNIAVAVAGIGSSTEDGRGPELYDAYLTRILGYPPSRTYNFSYRGLGGARLHGDYEQRDTYGDLRGAAARLEELLDRISLAHPEAGFDLIAHSQGGVVARLYLERAAEDPGAPQIEHLVTYAAPHRGTSLARAVDDIREDTFTGRWALNWLSYGARHGFVPLPDPNATSIRQLEPNSGLMRSLAREDLAYGTQALSLAAPIDAMVPAHMSVLRNEVNHVVPPAGLWGHDAILSGPESQVLAHRFLRDAPDVCRGLSDVLGPFAGRAVVEGHRALPEAYSKVEERAAGRIAGALRRLGGGALRWVLDRVRRVLP